jgi:transcriptional regulator with XRE-family HTH domain
LDFGKRLRSLRVLHRLSLKEASLLIGVPVTTYRDWEYGKRIQGQPYINIARAFGITLNQLFGVDDSDLTLEQKLDAAINELQQVRSALGSSSRKTR